MGSRCSQPPLHKSHSEAEAPAARRPRDSRSAALNTGLIGRLVRPRWRGPARRVGRVAPATQWALAAQPTQAQPTPPLMAGFPGSGSPLIGGRVPDRREHGRRGHGGAEGGGEVARGSQQPAVLEPAGHPQGDRLL